MIKKIILTAIFSLLSVFSLGFSNSYKVDLPDKMTDIKSEGTIEAGDEKDVYINFSKIINEYLWFILGSIAFGIIIYAGVLLMKSNGDEAELKKGNKILVWGIVGIFVSLGAYTIVNLLINIL